MEDESVDSIVALYLRSRAQRMAGRNYEPHSRPIHRVRSFTSRAVGYT